MIFVHRGRGSQGQGAGACGGQWQWAVEGGRQRWGCGSVAAGQRRALGASLCPPELVRRRLAPGGAQPCGRVHASASSTLLPSLSHLRLNLHLCRSIKKSAGQAAVLDSCRHATAQAASGSAACPLPPHGAPAMRGPHPTGSSSICQSLQAVTILPVRVTPRRRPRRRYCRPCPRCPRRRRHRHRRPRLQPCMESSLNNGVMPRQPRYQTPQSHIWV